MVDAAATYLALRKHYEKFFGGHTFQELAWHDGPIRKVLPNFRVLEVAPGPKSRLWVYLSMGAWEIEHCSVHRLEFLLISPIDTRRMVELLAMNAFYHRDSPVGLGHTFPIGQPWLEQSQCDHCLVSLPYPFGPDLERLTVDPIEVQVLWLLPITRAERDFKVANGLEALESLFEESELEYWQPTRPCVIAH